MKGDDPAPKRLPELPAAWQQVMTEGSPSLPEAILASWQRSRSHQVDPELPHFRRVPEDELQERLRANALLVELARPHLAWIRSSLEHPHVIYLTDRDGIVLLSHATSDDQLERYGLTPGHDWSERQMGTNGAGTALVTGAPVAVVGCAHYCRLWHASTCLGAPLVLPGGEIVGAIDLSATVEDTVPGELKLVAHTAWALSRELAARRAVEDRNAVLASVSHELRNAVGAVQLAAAVLASQTADNPPTARVAARLGRSAELLRRLVEDLLDASAIESGRFRIDPLPCDAASLAEQAREGVMLLAEDRGVIVEQHVGPGVDRCRCDGERIVQVLINLLKNSIEHSPAGGRVTLALRAQSGGVRFSVRDQGPGIPADEVPRLFRRRTRQGRRGMGLGLLISRGIVESHGGRLAVDSEEGRGTEIWFTLPGCASGSKTS